MQPSREQQDAMDAAAVRCAMKALDFLEALLDGRAAIIVRQLPDGTYINLRAPPKA